MRVEDVKATRLLYEEKNMRKSKGKVSESGNTH